MRLALQPRHAAGAVWGVLAAALAAAFYMRLQAIAAYGGQEDYLAWAVGHYVGGITPMYLALADQILSGRYAFLGYPPGYSAFLAALRLAGIDDLQCLRMAQAAIDCLGVPLVYFLMRRAGVVRALSLCGAVTYAVYPLFAAGSTFLLAEFLSPVVILAALSMAVLWADRDRPSPAFLVASGMFLGLAGLTRPDLLLLPGALALWYLWQHPSRHGVLAMVIVMAGFAVPVSAWGLHNRIQHGHWVFTSTGGGNTLWEGLGEIPNDHGYVLDDAKAGEVLARQGLTWLSVEADRYFKGEYLRAWREHPEFVARVLLNRWQRLVTESETWFPEAWPVIRLQQLFNLGGVVLVAGAILLYPRSPVALLIAALPLAYALASIGMTHFEPRYSRYVHLSYLFAAFLFASLVVDRIDRRSRRAAVAATALACVVTAWAAGSALVAVTPHDSGSVPRTSPAGGARS